MDFPVRERDSRVALQPPTDSTVVAAADEKRSSARGGPEIGARWEHTERAGEGDPIVVSHQFGCRS